MTAYINSNESPSLGEPITEYSTLPTKHYEWLLRRFTAPEWTVNGLRIERNTHTTETDQSVLEGTLKHQTDAIIQIVPVDPQEHNHDTRVYTENRVRLNPADNTELQYITVDNLPESTPDSPQQFIKQFTSHSNDHPYDRIGDSCSFHKQTAVHARDQRIFTNNEIHDRPHTLQTKPKTLLAVFAGAQRITDQQTNQSGIADFL